MVKTAQEVGYDSGMQPGLNGDGWRRSAQLGVAAAAQVWGHPGLVRVPVGSMLLWSMRVYVSKRKRYQFEGKDGYLEGEKMGVDGRASQ